MFTLDQIKKAHSKVQSGADFPAYIQELKALGLVSYDTFVVDGHADYFGTGNYKVSSVALYDRLAVDEVLNQDEFKADLKAHQEGKTDYLMFCRDCAKSGIEKWTIDFNGMTCTYYDAQGQEVLVEQIPA